MARPTPDRRFSSPPSSPFESPDRFISRRPTIERTDSFRVGKRPESLSPSERYHRQRDHSVDPFRYPSGSRSRNAVQRRATAPGQRARPMYHVPSFVHGYDATPVNADASGGSPAEFIRQVSLGAVWNVGGPSAAQPGSTHGVPDGHGGLNASGSNAPMHTAGFLDRDTPNDQTHAHENRLALALNIDQTRPILRDYLPSTGTSQAFASRHSPFTWQNGEWSRGHDQRHVSSDHSAKSSTPEKAVPVTPFRVLDAPHLKDDYYCTVLAYSHSHRTLAVALWQKVYLWTEKEGVKYPPIPQARHANFVTSLSFSSTQGGKGILAVSRNSGQVLLWGIDEQWARFEAPHQNSVSCLSFKPSVTCRRSVNGVGAEVACEDLLVGDDTGVVYFYSVEWPDLDNTDLTESRAGAMTLLARVTAHVQNICGLAWCPDGKHFATGGNDNTALFFETARVLERRQPSREASPRGRALRKPDEFPISASSSTNTQLLTPPASPDRPNITGTHDFQSFQTAWETNFTPVPTTLPNTPPQSPPRTETREQTPRPVAVTPLGPRLPLRTPVQIIRQPAILQRLPFPTSEAIQNVHIHAFVHSAAVKALAFAPWQPSLLATGGGSNDRQIHFHHTGSGATLAVINVFAQITCLIWSRTRREIAATFGYAQPEHGVRVAVFAWPSCECVVKIPWEGRNGGSGEVPRALWAVGYPGGPNDGAMPAKSPSGRRQRTDEEQGMAQWEAVRQMERRAVGEIGETPTAGLPRPRQSASPRLTTVVSTSQRSAEMSPSRRAAEGAAWTSRTEEEGSLIIACCDQTVKFFEVWAGSSKSRRGRGLGNKAGVLGGSRILELETAGIFESEDGTGRGSMGAEVIR